jgi:hypothetical protein
MKDALMKDADLDPFLPRDTLTGLRCGVPFSEAPTEEKTTPDGDVTTEEACEALQSAWVRWHSR